jgi:hypothetical protein
LEEGVHSGFGDVAAGAAQKETLVPLEFRISLLPGLKGMDGAHLDKGIGDMFVHAVVIERQKLHKGRDCVLEAEFTDYGNSE